MELSKAFDSMPHDLLIAKTCVYGFSIDSFTSFNLHLKRRKQNVRIIYTRSVFAILLSGVPKVQYFGHFYSTADLKILIYTKKQAIKCDRMNSEVHSLYGKRSALKQFRLI